LGVIRSWDFDSLVVILFDLNGNIMQAIEIGVDATKKLAKFSEHQNGWILTTKKDLMGNINTKDITISMKKKLEWND
jgi:hypothetical protein